MMTPTLTKPILQSFQRKTSKHLAQRPIVVDFSQRNPQKSCGRSTLTWKENQTQAEVADSNNVYQLLEEDVKHRSRGKSTCWLDSNHLQRVDSR